MQETTLFERVLEGQWDEVAPVIRRHYGLRGEDSLTMRGVMTQVGYVGLGRLFAPFARLLGALVPYGGREVPITVENWTAPGNNGYFWRRRFHFPGRPETLFSSCMEYRGPGEVVERMRSGIGIRLATTVRTDGGLHMEDLGYEWRLGRLKLPLPIGLLMGRTLIDEWPTGTASFAMRLDIVHPWWGETFHYDGTFQLAAEEAV